MFQTVILFNDFFNTECIELSNPALKRYRVPTSLSLIFVSKTDVSNELYQCFLGICA